MRRSDAVAAVLAVLALATPISAQEPPEYPPSFSEPMPLTSEALGPFSRHASSVPCAFLIAVGFFGRPVLAMGKPYSCATYPIWW